jgi:hypothetical protein
VDFLDAASERSQRIDVGRYGEMIQMLSLIGEKANVSDLDRVQRATYEVGLLEVSSR